MGLPADSEGAIQESVLPLPRAQQAAPSSDRVAVGRSHHPLLHPTLKSTHLRSSSPQGRPPLRSPPGAVGRSGFFWMRDDQATVEEVLALVGSGTESRGAGEGGNGGSEVAPMSWRRPVLGRRSLVGWIWRWQSARSRRRAPGRRWRRCPWGAGGGVRRDPVAAKVAIEAGRRCGNFAHRSLSVGLRVDFNIL